MPGFYFWGRYFVQDSNNDMEHNFVYLIQTRHHLVDRETSGSSRVTMLCRPPLARQLKLFQEVGESIFKWSNRGSLPELTDRKSDYQLIVKMKYMRNSGVQKLMKEYINLTWFDATLAYIFN